MRQIPCNDEAASAAVRRLPALLLLLVLLFVVQTGLVPYDMFVASDSAVPSSRLVSTADHTTLGDTVANVFLYVPVGFLLTMTLARRRFGSLAAPIAAVAAGLAVSLGIEYLQSYSNSRVSSVVDVTANVTGTAVGALLATLWRVFFPSLWGAVLYELSIAPRFAATKLYAGLLLLIAMAPFSFCYSTVPLARAARDVYVRPFASFAESSAGAELAVEAGDQRAFALARWSQMKSFSRWGAEMISFALLAVLLTTALRSEFGFGHRAATVLTLWVCVAAAFVFSLAQIPVVSRAADGTDILFRLAGIAVGLLVFRSLRVADQGESVGGGSTGFLSILLPSATIGTGVFVAYNSLIPLTFDVGGRTFAASVSSGAFPPLFAYFHTRADVMLADVLEKFLSYAVLGGVMSSWWSVRSGRGCRHRGLQCGAICLALAAGLEACQAWIPIRVTSMSDPMIAFGGALVGVMVQTYAVATYRYAQASAMIGPAGAPASRLSVTDELIATLTEPDPSAPSEGARRRKGVRRSGPQ